MLSLPLEMAVFLMDVAVEHIKRPVPVQHIVKALKAHVRKVIERHGGNRSEAARALGISRGTLRSHLKG